MITLTKLNGEKFLLNCRQIEIVELIPESKVVLMNKEFYVVKETPEEIVRRIIDYNAEVMERSGIVVKKRDLEG